MPKTTANAKAKSVSKPYEPTKLEQAVLDGLKGRERHLDPVPDVIVEEGGQVWFDHPDAATASVLVMNAIGTNNYYFLFGLLSQLTNAASKGQKPDADAINFMLSVIKGIEPQDEAEAMLAAQMAATHMATMTFTRRLAHVDNIQQQDSAEKALNKLLRTFATQMQTLKLYRTSGQQKMVVEHVTVNKGGQAIVGNVNSRGGGRRKNSPSTS